MSEVTAQSISAVFSKSECYLANLAELSGELDDVLVKDDGQIIEFDLRGVVSTAQVLWDKFKEVAQECEGKTITVKLPEGILGMVLGASLQAIGFRL